MNDDEWLISFGLRAQVAPSDPRIRFVLLPDYLDALRYCRIFGIECENGQLLADSLRRFLQPRKARFIANWIPVSSGVMAFCGIFFCELDGSVISRTHVFWSLTEDVRSIIEGAIEELHKQYRQATKAVSAVPVPADGPQTN